MKIKKFILTLIFLISISNIYATGGGGHGCSGHCRVHGSGKSHASGSHASGYHGRGRYYGSYKRNDRETEEDKRTQRNIGIFLVLFLLFFFLYGLWVEKRRGDGIREKLTDAINDGCIQKVTELLSLEAIDINSYDYWGATPLSLAVQKNYADIVNVLLESGVNVTKKVSWYRTPLSIAIFKRNKEIFNLLVKEHKKCTKRSYIDKIILFFLDLKNKKNILVITILMFLSTMMLLLCFIEL